MTTMTEAKDDGGPAFPCSPAIGPSGDLYRPVDIGCQGISMRDYFAAKAMSGELSAQSEFLGSWGAAEKLANRAYEIADAMIEARKMP